MAGSNFRNFSELRNLILLWVIPKSRLISGKLPSWLKITIPPLPLMMRGISSKSSVSESVGHGFDAVAAKESEATVQVVDSIFKQGKVKYSL